MTKQDIRAAIKEQKKNMSEQDIKLSSQTVMEKLIQTSAFRDCSKIFCYVSFNQEVRTTDIIKYALNLGKIVAVPRIAKNESSKKNAMMYYQELKPNEIPLDYLTIPRKSIEIMGKGEANHVKYMGIETENQIEAEMKFFRISALEELLPGTLGIPEPINNKEEVPKKEDNNLFIVPGLAFDEMRNRIGYGKGFYDSYFSKYAKAGNIKIALAYDFQILQELPVNRKDKKVDQIITPEKIIN